MGRFHEDDIFTAFWYSIWDLIQGIIVVNLNGSEAFEYCNDIFYNEKFNRNITVRDCNTLEENLKWWNA